MIKLWKTLLLVRTTYICNPYVAKYVKCKTKYILSRIQVHSSLHLPSVSVCKGIIEYKKQTCKNICCTYVANDVIERKLCNQGYRVHIIANKLLKTSTQYDWWIYSLEMTYWYAYGILTQWKWHMILEYMLYVYSNAIFL